LILPRNGKPQCLEQTPSRTYASSQTPFHLSLVPKCYTYSEPEDESSDELETSKDGKVKPKPKVVKRIRKKRGRKKRYHPIIDDIRQELIDAVNNKGEKIKEVSHISTLVLTGFRQLKGFKSTIPQQNQFSKSLRKKEG